MESKNTLRQTLSQTDSDPKATEEQDTQIEKKTSKTLLIIVSFLGFIILLGAVSFGIFQLGKNSIENNEEETIEESNTSSTTANPTAQTSDCSDNWEVFESIEYGFKFCYPKDWELASVNGEPFNDGEKNPPGYSGFGVTLSKGDWKYMLSYNASTDDVGFKPTDHVKEIEIEDQTRYRIAFMEIASESDESPVPEGSEIIDSIEIKDKYTENTWEGGGFVVEEKYFLIVYSPQADTTYEESKDIIEEMDQISQTLTLTSPQPDDKSDLYKEWNSYKNTKYSYQIDYPSDWTIGTNTAGNPEDLNISNLIFINNICDYDNGDRCASIQISVDNKTSDILDDYLNLEDTYKFQDKLLDKEIVKISGVEFLKAEYYKDNYFYGSGDNEHGAIFVVYIYIKDSYVYKLTLSEAGLDRDTIESSNDWNYSTVMERIVESIQFI